MTATRLTGAVGALPDGVLTPSQPAGPYGDGTALSVDEEGLGGTSKARAVYSEAVAVAPLIKPEHGRVYTRRWVVEALLDLAGYTADRDLAEVALVEPSVGEGAFLIPVLERLLASVRAHGRSPADLGSALTCFDIHPENVERSRLLASEYLVQNECSPQLSESLATGWIAEADFLLDDQPLEADVVIGNPPYIRIEDLDPTVAAKYRERWPTMVGRADIYVGFFERSLRALKPGGRLGFICADRWMRNRYGAALRDYVSTNFAITDVWTMHDADAFEEQVSAYPAITIMRREPASSTSIVDADGTFGPVGAKELTAIRKRGHDDRPGSGPGYTVHRLRTWFSGPDIWPTGSPDRLALIEYLNENFDTLANPETSTKIGIGVATGADGVFVLNDKALIEADRALPLVMGKDLASGKFQWGQHYLANPWLPDGTLVDLDDYPLLAGYLERSSDQLRQRHTAKKQPHNWHRTIDKVNHELIGREKLLLRDLGSTINPVLEPGGYYPHHNLYFVISDKWDLEVLGGLLLSRIAQAFIEAYCVRMRGGTLRFQSQYLRRIRVPHPDAIDAHTADHLRHAFHDRDAHAATDAAADAYGISLADYGMQTAAP